MPPVALGQGLSHELWSDAREYPLDDLVDIAPGRTHPLYLIDRYVLLGNHRRRVARDKHHQRPVREIGFVTYITPKSFSAIQKPTNGAPRTVPAFRGVENFGDSLRRKIRQQAAR